MSFIVSCAVISNHNNGVGKLLVIYPLLKHFRTQLDTNLHAMHVYDIQQHKIHCILNAFDG